MATAPDTPFPTGAFTDGSSQPFVGAESHAHPRFDNQPPLEERIMLEFEEALKIPGDDGAKSIEARIAELLDAAERAPESIDDDAWAGKVGDFIRLARNVEGLVNDAREKHNRPLLTAQRSLKAKADQVLAPLLAAGGTLRARLNIYIAREEAKRREAEARANEAARLAQVEADRIARESSTDAVEVAAPIVIAAPIAKPVARGDLGSRVGGRTVWKHEIQVPIAKLPVAVLNNQKVVDAVNQVIGAMVRGGTHKIKGVRIFETTEASVR